MDEISKYAQVLMQKPHRNIPNRIVRHTAYHNFRINHFFFLTNLYGLLNVLKYLFYSCYHIIILGGFSPQKSELLLLTCI